MATCKDCLGYEFCSRSRGGQTNFYGKETACNNVEYLCPDFKDKSRFVEVVRCKDCEYYEIGKSHTPYCNNVLNMFEEMKPDDYCSYGERRFEE